MLLMNQKTLVFSIYIFTLNLYTKDSKMIYHISYIIFIFYLILIIQEVLKALNQNIIQRILFRWNKLCLVQIKKQSTKTISFLIIFLKLVISKTKLILI